MNIISVFLMNIVSVCSMNVHKRCKELVANTCGVNPRLMADILHDMVTIHKHFLGLIISSLSRA